MPTPIATLSKLTLRQLVSQRVDDWWPETLSSIGDAGGTTAVFSSLVGYARSSLLDRYLLLTSGTYAGQWRQISNFDTSNGTITVLRAFGGQVASAVTVEIHRSRPDLLSTLVPNQAMAELYGPLYREMLHHQFLVDSSQKMFGTPTSMRSVLRLSVDSQTSERMLDYFDRAASTTDPGPLWTANVGTWGVIGERLYSVSDADANLLLAASSPSVENGIIQAVVRGTLASGATYRAPGLVFRLATDYLGAVDTTNYLLVRLLNGSVDLRKVDAGSESSLSTGALTTSDGVDYVVRVMFAGSRIRVWVDNVEYISYDLLGLNLKYTAYGHVGIRWDKAGAPATAARVDDYRLHELVGLTELDDWQEHYGGRAVEVSPRGYGALGTGRILWFEGTAPLTALAADTTFGTLASDTTATIEIEAADPALNVLLDWCAALLYRQASQPGNTVSDSLRAEYVKQSAVAFALAQRTKSMYAMAQPKTTMRHL